MDPTTSNKIVSFIWGIADDVLRDLFKRGKYPDVVLPMCVIRRMDAVLEPTKQTVLDTKKMLDDARITEQSAALCDAAGQAFYNTSRFTLRDLKSRGSQQQLLADFEDYLNGFSPNVLDILENFKFRNQLPTLSKADALATLINKFLDPDIDLSPAGIDNHSMGTVFEELVRKFNEENNEEAGEHWTPRDAVRLMANLVFLPIESKLKSGTYLLFDDACGTGGMLTVAEETLDAIAKQRGLQINSHLYGQEINPETYAICKADMLLKGEGENADHIVGGAEWSTLSHDAFPTQEFDFMLANPPYGKSWKKDLEAMGGKDGMRDPRFKVMHDGEELSLVTRSSDGQMLFLVNMAAKMNHNSALGSRIAEVHNGSSLFTGDAGQGESNIRRWIIENDWLEAIVALPLNLFYNTGIATYIWVLSNRKPEYRKGQVQLIDASQWFKPLRKNLGKKNCELSPEDIDRITQTFLDFKETPESKIFPNNAFGYWKVTVERPLRLHSQLSLRAIEALRYASGDEDLRSVLFEEFGNDLFAKFSSIATAVEVRLSDWGSDEAEDEAMRAVSLPAVEVSFSAEDVYGKVHSVSERIAPPMIAQYECVELEVTTDNRRPDAVGSGGNTVQEHLIEVFVRHAVDSTKEAEFSAQNYICFEICLNNIQGNLSFEDLQRAVVASPERIRWVSYPGLSKTRQRLQVELTALIEIACQRKYQEEIESEQIFITSEDHEICPERKAGQEQIQLRLKREWLRAANQMKANVVFKSATEIEKRDFLRSKLGLNEESFSGITDSRVRGGKSFHVAYDVWQSDVFRALVFSGFEARERKFVLDDVLSWLLLRYSYTAQFPSSGKVAVWDYCAFLEKLGYVKHLGQQQFVVINDIAPWMKNNGQELGGWFWTPHAPNCELGDLQMASEELELHLSEYELSLLTKVVQMRHEENEPSAIVLSLVQKTGRSAKELFSIFKRANVMTNIFQ